MHRTWGASGILKGLSSDNNLKRVDSLNQARRANAYAGQAANLGGMRRLGRGYHGGGPPQRPHIQLRDAALLAAGLWLPFSGLLAAVASLEAAALTALLGVGANGLLAAYWNRIPTAVGPSFRHRATAWSAFSLWQAGGLMLLLASTSTSEAHVGAVGGYLLLLAALLAVEHFGTALYLTRATWMPRVRWAAGLLAVAAIPLLLAVFFVALSFRGEELHHYRELGLQLLGAGFLLPGLLAAGFLGAPAQRYAA